MLDDVSIEIATGSLTALLGPSGGGKSTLLRVIAGLEQPDTGTVIISGTDATRLPPQRRNVGFVFQHYAAFKHMTVFNNVAFGLQIRKRPKAEIRKRVNELLELVHLEQFAQRYPAQLSGGQRQRMALARALAVEPEVLLLDEPFGALDAQVRKELRTWLRRLHDEVHVTTVFVTHDQEEAMEVADQHRGACERQGRTGRQPARGLRATPPTAFVMSFLGPVTQLGDKLVRPHDIEICSTRPTAPTRRRSSGSSTSASRCGSSSSAPTATRLWAQVTRDRCEQFGLEEEPDRLPPLRSTKRVFSRGDLDRSTRSASEVFSRTPRMLARSSIQTSCSVGARACVG